MLIDVGARRECVELTAVLASGDMRNYAGKDERPMYPKSDIKLTPLTARAWRDAR